MRFKKFFFTSLIFNFIIYGCHEQKKKLQTLEDIEIIKLARKFPEMAKDRAGIPVTYHLQKTIRSERDSFQLKLYETSSANSNKKIIIASKNGHVYSIPMFEYEQFDYWNTEREDSADTSPSVGTTFEKEIKACCQETKIFNGSPFRFIREMMADIMDYEEGRPPGTSGKFFVNEIWFTGDMTFKIIFSGKKDFTLKTKYGPLMTL